MPSLIPCHAREAAWARREWSVLDMDLLEPCGEKCIISKSVKNFSTMMTLKKMFWHVQLFITATVILLWPNRCRTWSPWTWCNLHYLMQGNQCRADQIRSVTAHHEGSDQTRSSLQDYLLNTWRQFVMLVTQDAGRSDQDRGKLPNKDKNVISSKTILKLELHSSPLKTSGRITHISQNKQFCVILVPYGKHKQASHCSHICSMYKQFGSLACQRQPTKALSSDL